MALLHLPHFGTIAPSLPSRRIEQRDRRVGGPRLDRGTRPPDAPSTGGEAGSATDTAEAERLYRCAGCRALVTRGRWEMAMDGAHERAVFNPAGIVFRVLCFKEAPGAAAIGEPSLDFTWFRGFAWSIALCRACAAHLGWRYDGPRAPFVFFGLIKDRLTVDEAEREG